MHEILDSPTADYMKRNDRHYSYRRGPDKATICYLVLPSRTAKWETRLDPLCRGFDYYYGKSATSMIVDRNSLDLTEKNQRRFARAMLRLALKPSVHPSQLQQELSATSTIDNSLLPKQIPRPGSNKEVSEKEKEVRDLATTRRINDAEQSQWPKLMLLSHHIYSEN